MPPQPITKTSSIRHFPFSSSSFGCYGIFLSKSGRRCRGDTASRESDANVASRKRCDEQSQGLQHRHFCASTRPPEVKNCPFTFCYLDSVHPGFAQPVDTKHHSNTGHPRLYSSIFAMLSPLVALCGLALGSRNHCAAMVRSPAQCLLGQRTF